MWLKQITINNYKSCLKTTVDFNRDITALIGINGSGKTSILTAINLLGLLSSKGNIYRPSTQEVSEKTSIHALFMLDGDEQTELKVGVLKDGDDFVFAYTWKIRSETWIHIPLTIIPTKKDKKGIEPIKKYLQTFYPNENNSELIINYTIKIKKYLNSINYYSAAQFLDPSKCLPVIISNESSSAGSYFHEQFIMDLYKAYKDNKNKYERYINIIGANGIHLIDAITFLEFSSNPDTSNKDDHGLVVLPRVDVNKKTLSFNQLSEGTFKTISLLFYLLDSDNGLLLLEEPEVCVHHGLLTSIIEIILSESKNRQIIFSTHSDFVLDKLKPEDLLLVTNTMGTKAKMLSKTMTKKNYSALHKYLESSGNLGEYWKESGFEN